MPDLKPKIFIGSSSDGYDIAEKVKARFMDTCDCFLWKDAGVWEPNRSTFDNLIRIAGYFDFGIFVATADDVTLTNDKLVIEPRDNVILEMALFLGAMGRHKSFLLVEDGVKLPSDFNGIFMPRFQKNDEDSVTDACKAYKQKIEEYFGFGYLSLYPTTALAIGYYKNFIADLVESVRTAEALEFNGHTYSSFRLKVVIPADLKGHIRERADLFYRRHGFQENDMKAKFRSHRLWFQLDPARAPIALMYDMPSTLTGIDDAIELMLQKDYEGRSKMQQVIEQREINNFKRVLQLQIDKSPYARETVEIIAEF